MAQPPDISALLESLDKAPVTGKAGQGDGKRAKNHAALAPMVTRCNAWLSVEKDMVPPRILVICAAGPGSSALDLFPDWGHNQVDLCLVWYGDDSNVPEVPGAKCIMVRKGPKWQLVRAALLDGVPSWREDYDFIWLPDDDLKWETGGLIEFVRTARGLGLVLCQPSLVDENMTCTAYRAVLTRPTDYPNVVGHRTNFVEIMCPLLTSAALARVFETFNNDICRAGWGLDSVWPRLLPHDKIGVVDSVRIFHTRPPNSFNRKSEAYQGGVDDPRLEEHNLLTKYRVGDTKKRLLEVFVT